MGIALALGVFLGVRAGLDHAFALFAAVVGGLALLNWFAPRGARPLLLSAVVGCLLGLASGLWRAPGAVPLYTGPLAINRSGTIVSDPNTSGDGAYADLRWTDSAGVARASLAFLPPAPGVGRGDRVEFGGDVLDQTGTRLSVTALRVVVAPGRIEQTRRSLRRGVTDAVLRDVPGSPGTLTLGLLIGDDSGLTAAERADLRGAGLSHVTAVSGWNVSLVIAAVAAVFLALGWRGRYWLAPQLAAIAGYVWLVGAEPPVTRAALMGGAALVAVQLGRPAHTLNALALTAAALAVYAPAAPGELAFQLSTLATVGVAIALQWTRRMHGWRAVALAPAIVSASAGLATAPLLAARFGTFTLAALPANILAGPLVSTATFAGGVLLPTSAIGLGAWSGSVAWLASWLLLALARWFAAAPVGQWTFAPLSDVAIFTLYALLALLGAAALPEGRLARRRLGQWAARDPGGAAAAAATAAAMAGLVLLVG